jgi:hypothetical protein
MSDTNSPLSKHVLEERNDAYSRAVPHSHIQGLYPSFSTAVTILRIARSLGELDVDVVDLALELEPVNGSDKVVREEKVVTDETAHLDEFYEKLSVVERYLLDTHTRSSHASASARSTTGENSPFIVVVEGLDGTGTLRS